MILLCVDVDTPVGKLRLHSNGRALVLIEPTTSAGTLQHTVDHILKQGLKQVQEYFEGTRREFSVPTDISKVTEFRQKVFAALRNVAYGKTITYGGLAQKIDNPRAVRAVGTAMKTNPLPLIYPCHRVTAAHSIGGFALGVDIKKQLLDFEQHNV